MRKIGDILHKIDLEEIQEVQESYMTESNGYNKDKIPLAWIPELTYELYRNSVNWTRLSKKTKEIRKYNGRGYNDEELSDGYLDMIENSTIQIDNEYNKRRQWTIVYDGYSQIYWKKDSDIVMDNFVNYILND